MKIIDLHTHSNISDGSCTPRELIQLAHETGIAAIALTDHDTIAGIQAAEEAAKEVEIDFLPGMEMSVQYKGRKLHIVALGFDCTHWEFQRIYKKIRMLKETGIAEAVERIRKEGIDIDMEMLKKNFTTSDQLDRYAIMRYFVSLNLFEDVQKIWDNYINQAFSGLDLNITAEEGIAAIKVAGGVTSLAHYHKRIGLSGLTRDEQETAMQELLALGLDGMEGCYPNYSLEDQEFAAYLIRKYTMLPTGGTDFHGKNRSDVALGTGINNNISAPYAWYENIIKHCEKRK
ncbi:PHP domain-containing protein [Anaerosinus massiliensis]|uniref:PHP domain-containing protein n=1 Tax=Massilibacillus massiliensis TaxID=1806837 RepID=UPI000A5CDF6C|nr:PHP domain-containing protein [Massilibacillus massiliensis]